MKRISATVTAALPLVYAAAVLAMFVFRAGDDTLFSMLGGFLLLGAVANICYCVTASKADAHFIAVSNLRCLIDNLIIHIGQIIWLVIYTVNTMEAEKNGAMEGGLGVFLLMLLFIPHWLTYLMTRIACAVLCNRALKSVYCSSGVRTLHVILHLLPIADCISAGWVLRTVNGCHSFQQPPIEN